jgi:hypothetical protein
MADSHFFDACDVAASDLRTHDIKVGRFQLEACDDMPFYNKVLEVDKCRVEDEYFSCHGSDAGGSDMAEASDDPDSLHSWEDSDSEVSDSDSSCESDDFDSEVHYGAVGLELPLEFMAVELIPEPVPSEVSTLDMAKQHELGICRPCLYVASRVGCLRGSECRFCHFPHAKSLELVRKQCKEKQKIFDGVSDGYDSDESTHETPYLVERTSINMYEGSNWDAVDFLAAVG